MCQKKRRDTNRANASARRHGSPQPRCELVVTLIPRRYTAYDEQRVDLALEFLVVRVRDDGESALARDDAVASRRHDADLVRRAAAAHQPRRGTQHLHWTHEVQLLDRRN